MANPEATGVDFENTSWHDNCLYGIAFRLGDIEANDWRSELELEIDHIAEWVKDANGRFQFHVAPALLTFHDVTDLKIGVDWGNSGNRVALHEPTIQVITRESVSDQKIYLDRPYYTWSIALNSPVQGKLSFGASGYTQKLLCDPILCDEQQIPRGRRQALLNGLAGAT